MSINSDASAVANVWNFSGISQTFPAAAKSLMIRYLGVKMSLIHQNLQLPYKNKSRHDRLDYHIAKLQDYFTWSIGLKKWCLDNNIPLAQNEIELCLLEAHMPQEVRWNILEQVWQHLLQKCQNLLLLRHSSRRYSPIK